MIEPLHLNQRPLTRALELLQEYSVSESGQSALQAFPPDDTHSDEKVYRIATVLADLTALAEESLQEKVIVNSHPLEHSSLLFDEVDGFIKAQKLCGCDDHDLSSRLTLGIEDLQEAILASNAYLISKAAIAQRA